jgi:membrane fusion protein (multidrug efflux system)
MTTVDRLKALVAVLALAGAGCGDPAQTAPAGARAVPVRTAVVEARDLDQALTLTGTLRPRKQAQVSAEVGGRLVHVLRDDGDRVRTGDILALLDATDYRLAHDRARASLQVAEANRAHAQAEEERAQNLLRTGGITDKDRLAAQVNLRVAEAGVAQARAEAAIAAAQQGRAAVRAPFTGRVAGRLADPGTMIAAGAPLFTVVDDSVFELRAAVPSASYNAIRVGAPVQVTVDSAPGLAIAGRVARVAPLVDERNRSFEVVIEVPGNPSLVGGVFARASVAVGRIAGAVVVPPGAVLRGVSEGTAEVWVVNGAAAAKRTVTVGAELADGVHVLSGLAAGERVVVDPPAGLAPGVTIAAQDAAAAAR